MNRIFDFIYGFLGNIFGQFSIYEFIRDLFIKITD